MAGRGRHRLAAAGLVVLAALAGCGEGHRLTVPQCTSGDLVLTTEQTVNAATIAAVGSVLRVPEQGVTVALATAFQESGLRNLDYGDRDSLGLFQQRPSQGWGTPARILTPRLSAAAFYRRLVQVEGWQSLPVTVAAQRVQRSGAPSAYAQWEQPARTLSRALTGAVPAGLACRYDPPQSDAAQASREGRAAADRALRRRAAQELGPRGLRASWHAASWLVANARDHGLSRVSVAGQTWTAASGAWTADPRAERLTWA